MTPKLPLLLANLRFTRYKANSKAGWHANEAKLTIQTAPELQQKNQYIYKT